MGGIDMDSERGARQVLDAIASPEVGEADRLPMTAIILTLASDAARQILEAMMTTSEYEKTFVEKIHDQTESLVRPGHHGRQRRRGLCGLGESSPRLTTPWRDDCA